MKKLVAALIVVALGALVIPVQATHVQEPTAPIERVRFRAGQYPGLDFKCDGTDVVDFNNLRIEPVVRVTARPSEHWQLNFTLESPDHRGIARQDWDIHPAWHENASPHGPTLNAEAMQLNHYNIQDRPGDYNLKLVVRGSESGLERTAECPFRVVAD